MLTAPLLLFEVGELLRSARGAPPGPGGDPRCTHARAANTGPLRYGPAVVQRSCPCGRRWRVSPCRIKRSRMPETRRDTSPAWWAPARVEVCFRALIPAHVRPLSRQKWRHFIPPLTAGAPRPIESDHQAVPAPPTANGRSQGFGERSTSELVLASGQDGAIRRKPIVLLRCLGLIHGLKLWRAVAGTFYGPIDSTVDRNCSQVSN